MYKEILGYLDEEVTQFLLEGVIITEHDIPDILKPKKPKQAALTEMLLRCRERRHEKDGVPIA